jgi:hypothetical protein
MWRTMIGSVLGFCIVLLPAFGVEKPKPPAEKIDGSVDRSLTGFIEKIDAKDEKSGTFVMRTDKDLPRYTFQVDANTKVLSNRSDPLADGFKSPLLVGAEVLVVFIDRKPNAEKKDQKDTHICRTLQIIKAEK